MLTITTKREKPEALICYPLHTMPTFPNEWISADLQRIPLFLSTATNICHVLKSVLAAKVHFHDACFTAPSVINVH